MPVSIHDSPLAIAVLINVSSILLPRELHARVTRTVSDHHRHPALRNRAVVDEVDRSSRHCRRRGHVQGLRVVGLRHASSVLRDDYCRRLRRRSGGPLDVCCGAVAD